jgi:hemin uptake protein HemP
MMDPPSSPRVPGAVAPTGNAPPPLAGADSAGPLAHRAPIRSSELFGEAVEVLIEHHAQVYRLRRTSLGKLILTK